MNKSKIANLILKASKLKRAGKNSEYLKALTDLRTELLKQSQEINEGIALVDKKISEAKGLR